MVGVVSAGSEVDRRSRAAGREIYRRLCSCSGSAVAMLSGHSRSTFGVPVYVVGSVGRSSGSLPVGIAVAMQVAAAT